MRVYHIEKVLEPNRSIEIRKGTSSCKEVPTSQNRIPDRWSINAFRLTSPNGLVPLKLREASTRLSLALKSER